MISSNTNSDVHELGASVGVLGLGNWGTALASHLASQGLRVLGWTRSKEIVSAVQSSGRHPFCYPEQPLPKGLEVTEKLEDLQCCRKIVLAVPSHALESVLVECQFRSDTLLISGIKGMAGEGHSTPLEIVQKVYAGMRAPAVISGPGFAKDLVRALPISLVVASKDASVAQEVANLFSSPQLRMYTSTDPRGVELGGILKNVIALAAGVSDGLELGDSARAGVITRGLAEMSRVAVAAGARVETLQGLSGLGDLVLTATGDASRNRTVGLRLGRGESLAEIIGSLGSVAEGVRTAPMVRELAEELRVEVPITEQVCLLLDGKVTAREMTYRLMTRPLRAESD